MLKLNEVIKENTSTEVKVWQSIDVMTAAIVKPSEMMAVKEFNMQFPMDCTVELFLNTMANMIQEDQDLYYSFTTGNMISLVKESNMAFYRLCNTGWISVTKDIIADMYANSFSQQTQAQQAQDNTTTQKKPESNAVKSVTDTITTDAETETKVEMYRGNDKLYYLNFEKVQSELIAILNVSVNQLQGYLNPAFGIDGDKLLVQNGTKQFNCSLENGAWNIVPVIAPIATPAPILIAPAQTAPVTPSQPTPELIAVTVDNGTITDATKDVIESVNAAYQSTQNVFLRAINFGKRSKKQVEKQVEKDTETLKASLGIIDGALQAVGLTKLKEDIERVIASGMTNTKKGKLEAMAAECNKLIHEQLDFIIEASDEKDWKKVFTLKAILNEDGSEEYRGKSIFELVVIGILWMAKTLMMKFKEWFGIAVDKLPKPLQAICNGIKGIFGILKAGIHIVFTITAYAISFVAAAVIDAGKFVIDTVKKMFGSFTKWTEQFTQTVDETDESFESLKDIINWVDDDNCGFDIQ